MHDRLIKAYLFMNRMPQAAEIAVRVAVEFPSPSTFCRAASICAHMNQWRQAEEITLRGLQLFADDQALFRIHADIERQMSRSLQPSVAGLELATSMRP
jgi:hypothetical protein